MFQGKAGVKGTGEVGVQVYVCIQAKCQLDYKKGKTGSFSQDKGITFKTYILLHCFPTCWMPCSGTKQSSTVLTHNIGIPFLLHKR